MLLDIITARSEWLAQMERGVDLGLLDCVEPSKSWLRVSHQLKQYGIAGYSCSWHCHYALLCPFLWSLLFYLG